MFQAGRFLSGLGIGILVTVCPMYLSEVSSPYRRGWLVGHHAIFLVFGYMLSSWVGFACYFAETTMPQFAWRFPLSLQCLPPLVLLIGSPWLPRSPRWLISKGKLEEARDVLRRLRQSTDDPNDLVAKEEFYQTKEQLHLEAEKLAATGCSVWTAVWKIKSYRKRMAIGFLTQWGAEFGGPLIIVSLELSVLVIEVEGADESQEQLRCAAIHQSRNDWKYAATVERPMAHYGR
jgi:MFS family permease